MPNRTLPTSDCALWQRKGNCSDRGHDYTDLGITLCTYHGGPSRLRNIAKDRVMRAELAGDELRATVLRLRYLI